MRKASPRINPRGWRGSFNGRESSIHQLSPYIGKMKTGMADALIRAFSRPGDKVFDPFCGSGVVPFQAAILGRNAWGSDLNPYAFALTKGKVEAPKTEALAIKEAEGMFAYIARESEKIDLRKVPKWVRGFFHPQTLRETISAFKWARREKNFFLLSCLLGILHHQRPGFLSFPSSHLVPYLRNKKFPRKKFPVLYEYRDLKSRLLAKIKRAYRNPQLPEIWHKNGHKILKSDIKQLSVRTKSVDVVISSPPYFGALSYARDNRLRLWFLGESHWQDLDSKLISRTSTYLQEMEEALTEIQRILKPNGFCVLVLGDVLNNGHTKNTAGLISTIARNLDSPFSVENIYSNKIPDNRRSRRKTVTTKVERILVLRKV